MTATLLAILRSALPAIADHLWQTTAFVLAISLFTQFFRRNRARVRCFLWLTASAKFLLPLSALVAVGSLVPLSYSSDHARRSTFISAVSVANQPFSTGAVTSSPNASSVPPQIASWLPPMLFLTWAIGSAVVLITWCVRLSQVSRTLRRSTSPSSDRETAILRRVERGSNSQTRIQLRVSLDLMEPGVCGILRPVMLWPAKLSDHLADAHLESILTHEIAHVHHRDNLIASLHMVVEAIFWFHPFVWWIERKMLEERERACDEAVIQSGGPAEIYAESLLKVSRFCAERSLPCIAGITGANLSERIRSIMTLAPERLSLGQKISVAVFGLAVTAAPVAFGVVRLAPSSPQVLHANGPLPSFEVATIKPLEGAPPPMPGGPPPLPPDEVRLLVNARVLISIAYNVQGFDRSEIVGGPAWLDDQIYEVHAKISPPLSEAMQHMSDREREQQIEMMEQSLLAQRFKLKAHFETRELPEFALVVAKRGPSLAPSDPSLPKNGSTRLSNGRGQELKSTGSTIQDLVQMLQSEPETGGRPILDKTGLTGSYDFTLKWSQDEAAGASSPNPGEPSLFTALQEQLGLKLVPMKGPVQVVVIDSIERPSPN